MFTCGPLKNLILLGSAPLFGKISELAKSQGVRTLIITSPDQLGELPQGLENVFSADAIGSKKTATFIRTNLQEGNTLAISFGARWILNEEVRRHLFTGKVLNAHGTRLPSDRGGGGFTWRVMRGDRIGNLMLHEVDDGIDTGPVIVSQDYIIPRNVRTPGEHQHDYMRRLEVFVCNFLEQVFSSEGTFQRKYQPNYNATYYPRVHTETHGWIDWSWDAQAIEKFILAFDDPFPGARTHWEGETAILKECQLHVGEIGHHPYQKGFVIRNNGKWLTVALEKEFSLICEIVKDLHGTDLLGRIKDGSRLHTEMALIETASTSRIQFDAKGRVQKKTDTRSSA